MIKVSGFVCEHCTAAGKKKRILASASGCIRHEKNCYYNPARRACVTCQLCEHDAPDAIEPDDIWGNGFSCKDGHDREDIGMCNGVRYKAAPQHDCEHWQPKVSNVELSGPL